MRFLQVKVPRNNEYTTQQAYGLFSSLFVQKKPKGITSLFSKATSTHYSFNIVSINQNIYFIVGSTENAFEHVYNQLLASYTKADITEVNINTIIPQEKIMVSHYAELNLAANNYLPLKNIEGTNEVDPISAILSSMSRSPDPQALFWFQMIVTPADSSWQSRVLQTISKLNSAEKVSQSAQAKIAQMQEKIKHNGFYTYNRLISNNPSNTNSMYSSFNLFANPTGNFFKLSKPGFMKEKKLLEAIATHSIYGTSNLLNISEISSVWHMPKGNIDIPNIIWGKRLMLDAPEELPIAHENMTEEEKKSLTFIGRTTYKNRPTIFGVTARDRLRHLYIVGKTGTGKSVLLVNMAIEDIRKGNGVAFLDPHGDAIDIILKYIPKNRINDVCYFNPADPEFAYPINILEVHNENQRELIVSGIIAIFYKIYAHSWGPRLEHILRNVLFTLVYAQDATLPDVMRILHDKNYRNSILTRVNDPQLLQFWQKEYDGMTEKFRDEAIAPILNKVGQFVTSPIIRRVIQWPKSKIRIEEIMDNKKIFLCDLSQGKLGEDNAALLGSMLITKIQVAAMNRAFISEDERVPFYLYVDEFQNFATSSFTKILSEARKYKLGLTLANQYITQIDEDVMNAILGNIGSIACYNVGAKDADLLYKEFGGAVEAEDLSNELDRFQMIMRMMISQTMSPPFTFYTLPLPKNMSGHQEKIIEASRRQYGTRLQRT